MAATVLALVAFGCGGGADEEARAGGGPKPAMLNGGILPIVETATLQIARDQGYFKDEKLTIKTQFAAGGAAIVPAVMSGDQQIGWSNTTAENPDEARAALLKYTEIPPAVDKRIRLPVWSRDIDRHSVEIQRDLPERYGWIRERPDLQELYPEIKTRSDAPASEE